MNDSRRDAGWLAASSAIGGVLAYVFFAGATRALGPGDAAPVSVLWTWWGLTAAAITFPLQHWITRDVAARGGFAGVRALLPVLGLLALAVAVVGGVATWLLGEPLFGSRSLAFPVLVALVTLGSALMGLLRGALSSRRRFRALGSTLLAENGVRCLCVFALVAAGVEDPAAYGAAIVVGHLSALVWTPALALPRTGEPPARSGLGLLLGAAGGQLLAQLVLTGGPVVLALLGGAPTEVTALFVGLAIYRAPYIVAVGVVPQATGVLTTLVLERRHDQLRRVRRVLVAVTLAVTAAAVPVGLWVGPPLIRLVFGGEVVLDRWVSAMLAAGSVLAVANLVAAVLAIVHARSHASTTAWLAGVVVAAPLLFTGLGEDVRIGAWFLVVESVAFAVLLLSVRTARGLRVAAP